MRAYYSVIPLGIVVLVMVIVTLGHPVDYSVERSIKIGVKRSDLVAYLRQPESFLTTIPLGDGILFPDHGEIETIDRYDQERARVILTCPDPFGLDYHFHKGRGTLQLITYRDTCFEAGPDKQFVQFWRVTKLDHEYSLITVVVTFRPETFVQKLLARCAAESRTTVLFDEALFRLRERFEIAQRR